MALAKALVAAVRGGGPGRAQGKLAGAAAGQEHAEPDGANGVVFHFISTKFFRLFRWKAEEFCGLIHYCRKELQWRA